MGSEKNDEDKVTLHIIIMCREKPKSLKGIAQKMKKL
jgi:hypothetical protein